MTIGEGVENFLQKRLEPSEGLLVGLNTGGCTGFTVSLLKKDLNDITLQNIRLCQQVYVETESQKILSDCALTVSEDPFSQRLTVVVPKEKFDQCGCAESFAPKNPTDYYHL